mmetsp:Transcript_3706/g.10972  ORF Transcript_3706/g.10972 Transcript_3706/m.10972 type:complete len:436 (+) Transcript_3706:229-1536(+)
MPTHEDAPNGRTKGGSAKKSLDVEMLLDMCVLRLRLPEQHKKRRKSALAVKVGSAGQGACAPIKQVMARMTGAGARGLSKATGAGKSGARLLSKSTGLSDLDLGLAKPRRPCLCTCLCACCNACYFCCNCSCLPRSIGDHIRAGRQRIFDWLPFRVSLTPLALVLLWVAVRLAVSIALEVMGPLARIWLPILALLLPYAAVLFGLLGLVMQAYFVAMPLAQGIAKLVQDLADIVDFAFKELLALLPKTIAKLLSTMGVPDSLGGNVVKALFLPIQEALNQVMGLIPRVDEVFPAWSKKPWPLVPLIFGGLLFGLFTAQALMFLTLGMVGKGDAAVFFSFLLCAVLGALGWYADRILPILLWIVETVINVAIQFLLRKVVAVDKLQTGIDMAQRAVAHGAKISALRAVAKPALDRVSVPMSQGSLVKQIHGGAGSG